MHIGEQQDPILRKNRQELQGAVLGRKGKSSDIADKSGGLRDDRDRGAIKKSIKRVIKQLREKYNRFSERIRELKARKCLDTTDVQRDHRTKQANQRAIDVIKQETVKLEKKNRDIRIKPVIGYSVRWRSKFYIIQ